MTERDKFRASLLDAATIIKILGQTCEDFGDAIGMINLALTNDGMLKMLMAAADALQEEETKPGTLRAAQ